MDQHGDICIQSLGVNKILLGKSYLRGWLPCIVSILVFKSLFVLLFHRWIGYRVQQLDMRMLNQLLKIQLEAEVTLRAIVDQSYNLNLRLAYRATDRSYYCSWSWDNINDFITITTCGTRWNPSSTRVYIMFSSLLYVASYLLWLVGDQLTNRT